MRAMILVIGTAVVVFIMVLEALKYERVMQGVF